jgi:hypothetical protein
MEKGVSREPYSAPDSPFSLYEIIKNEALSSLRVPKNEEDRWKREA